VDRFHHRDHLGSLRVSFDERGWPTARHDFYPFGREMRPAPGESRRMFTGHERDAGSGLDYMLARYGGSNLARLLSVDPGASVSLRGPQSWNRYAYVQNSPLNRIDPDGLKDWATTNGHWQDQKTTAALNSGSGTANTSPLPAAEPSGEPKEGPLPPAAPAENPPSDSTTLPGAGATPPPPEASANVPGKLNPSQKNPTPDTKSPWVRPKNPGPTPKTGGRVGWEEARSKLKRLFARVMEFVAGEARPQPPPSVPLFFVLPPEYRDSPIKPCVGEDCRA
jgi:RHS repeat-associated protein